MNKICNPEEGFYYAPIMNKIFEISDFELREIMDLDTMTVTEVPTYRYWDDSVSGRRVIVEIGPDTIYLEPQSTEERGPKHE